MEAGKYVTVLEYDEKGVLTGTRLPGPFNLSDEREVIDQDTAKDLSICHYVKSEKV